MGGAALLNFMLSNYLPDSHHLTQEETGRLIGEAITSADMDAALSLYEPDATFALPAAFGEGSVTGLDGLREAFGGLLALSPELTVNAEKTLVSGDTEK